MAVTNGYCTVAEVRTHLGDTGTKLTTESLEFAINAASRAVDKFTGRKFWLDSAVATRVYRPTDAQRAWVDDIGTTTGLVVKTDTTGDYTWATTLASDDYQLEPLNSDSAASEPYAWWILTAIDDELFPIDSRRYTLQVTAKFGWSAVPDEVKYAALLKSVSLFKRRDAPFGVAGFGEFGAVRITRRDPDVLELLEPLIRYDLRAV